MFVDSVAESDSVDAESGFEEADPGEAGNNVIKMVSRFVDKVRYKSYTCSILQLVENKSVFLSLKFQDTLQNHGNIFVSLVLSNNCHAIYKNDDLASCRGYPIIFDLHRGL